MSFSTPVMHCSWIASKRSWIGAMWLMCMVIWLYYSYTEALMSIFYRINPKMGHTEVEMAQLMYWKPIYSTVLYDPFEEPVRNRSRETWICWKTNTYRDTLTVSYISAYILYMHSACTLAKLHIHVVAAKTGGHREPKWKLGWNRPLL